MARIVGTVALLLLSACAVQGASPVQKVIELLEANKAKVAKNLAAEEAEMAEYVEFCDSETQEKNYAIGTATKKIAELTAEIEDGDAQIAEYADEVAAEGTAMAEKEKQLDVAEVERKAENDAFVKSEKELITSIDELEGAISELKRASAAPELVQIRGAKAAPKHRVSLKAALTALKSIVDASWVNGAARKQIQGMLQEGTDAADEDDLSLAAPSAAAYESATGGVVGTMEEMMEKAEASLTDLRNAEMNKKHSFEMMAQSLTDAIAVAKSKISDAKSASEAAAQDKGENQAELTETAKTKASDEDYLKSLTADCTEASEAWATRQEEAKGEMGALDKAKEILAERVTVLTQVHKAGENDVSDAQDNVRQAVLVKIKSLSKEFHSYALMEMVSAVAADPFEKIKGLIENMIAKLVEEANQEATQKAFCDEEISKSKASKAEKDMDLEKLGSRLDSAGTKKAELADTVKELEAEVADLDKSTAESTKLRTEEKATNAEAMADYKQAAEAVEDAMQVLKEYYEGAAALVQTKKGSQPSFGSKKSDAASSILSILEMCGEDFTKMYMEISQSETEAEAEYKKLMLESTVSRASKMAEIKGSESEIKSLEVALKDHKEDYDMTSQELDAVLSYLDKLKPQCETKAMSYEEKKARREAELEGLKEALAILEQ